MRKQSWLGILLLGWVFSLLCILLYEGLYDGAELSVDAGHVSPMARLTRHGEGKHVVGRMLSGSIR